MLWDYFLKSMGLKEQEQVPDSQNKCDESEEIRISSEPGSSMNPVQTKDRTRKGSKMRNMPPKTKNP